MSWSIAELVNTVNISDECAEDLFAHGQECQGELWYEVEEVRVDGRLFFNPDHMEHMDYLSQNDAALEILKKHKVKGDICFGSMEGDNKGSFWGYRFDGKGGMKTLCRNKTRWEEEKEGVLSGKVVVITGVLHGMTRSEAHMKVEDAGGQVAAEVTKKVNLLVVGDNPGSKVQKAQKLGIKIMSGKDFLELLH